MRPSKLKTPLAKLRAMLKVEAGEKTQKRTGKSVKTYAPLSRQDVAGWLGCGVDNISSIECGRVELTEENAEIIMMQTGANRKWLLGLDTTPHPITVSGRRLAQADFRRAQETVKAPAFPMLKAQRVFAENVGLLATTLLCACQANEVDRCASKLRCNLSAILQSLPKTSPIVDFCSHIDTSEGVTVTDHGEPLKVLKKFYPMLVAWDRELLRVLNARMKQAARK